jgi:hypothetical protein
LHRAGDSRQARKLLQRLLDEAPEFSERAAAESLLNEISKG